MKTKKKKYYKRKIKRKSKRRLKKKRHKKKKTYKRGGMYSTNNSKNTKKRKSEKIINKIMKNSEEGQFNYDNQEILQKKYYDAIEKSNKLQNNITNLSKMYTKTQSDNKKKTIISLLHINITNVGKMNKIISKLHDKIKPSNKYLYGGKKRKRGGNGGQDDATHANDRNSATGANVRNYATSADYDNEASTGAIIDEELIPGPPIRQVAMQLVNNNHNNHNNHNIPGDIF
tara:strand:- start:778 stop:1467 length:690 start_codon:yes stop_codon:yes gene_type:complete